MQKISIRNDIIDRHRLLVIDPHVRHELNKMKAIRQSRREDIARALKFMTSVHKADTT